MGDLRWGFFYYRQGRKRSFGRLGVPPRGWRASPPKRAAGKFWFGRRGKTRSWSKTVAVPVIPVCPQILRNKYGVPRFEEVIHPYKYMRIYLWSALRTMVLRMSVLRKRDLIADLRCLLTRQEDGGQALQKERRASFGLDERKRDKRQGRRTKLPDFAREVIHPYKYMRIYLWTILRTIFFRC